MSRSVFLIIFLAFLMPLVAFGEDTTGAATERKIDLRSLPPDQALVIGKSNAPTKVFVFSDPG